MNLSNNLLLRKPRPEEDRKEAFAKQKQQSDK